MTKRRETTRCPECGAVAIDEVRADTVEYKGRKATVKVAGHWCDRCGEAVLEGVALEKREQAFLELRVFQKYESGSQQVSVPMTNLLRLLGMDPRRLAELSKQAARAQGPGAYLPPGSRSSQ